VSRLVGELKTSRKQKKNFFIFKGFEKFTAFCASSRSGSWITKSSARQEKVFRYSLWTKREENVMAKEFCAQKKKLVDGLKARARSQHLHCVFVLMSI
jgi:hypothetical protein